MGFFIDLMKGAATKATGGIIDAGFGALNAYQNYRYGEKAADNADARQRAQWRDMYSLEAQMRQIKEAGLSPSMFFSGGLSGQGGANAPQGSGASGPMFNSSPIDVQAIASANELDSRANLNNAQAKLLGEQTLKQQWDNYITSKTAGTTIRMKHAEFQALMAQTNLVLEQTEGQEFTNEFNKENREKLVRQLEYQLENMLIDVWLKHTEGEKNYAHARNLTEQIQWYIGDITAKRIKNNIDQQKADDQQQWYRDQAENLVKKLNLDKYLASISAAELGLHETATETERLNVWLDFIADMLKGVAILRGSELNLLGTLLK